MIIKPIIPIKIMIIICVVLLLFKRKGIFPFIRQILIVALLFVINLRIMIPSDNVKKEVSKMDAYVVFVVDDTISMLAEDYSGNETRLSAVYKDAEYIVNDLRGAKFSVISFNNNAQVILPFTDNAEQTISTIQSVKPLEEIYAKGTTLNVSKEVLLKSLKNAYEKGDGKVFVFYISDGEINSKGSLDSFSAAAEYLDGGAVLGYGTSKGGKMHYEDYSGEIRTIKDSNYNDAISKLDEDNLKKLAKDMDIDYIHMSSQSDIDGKLKDIKAKIASSTESDISKGYKDIYWIFVIPLALILIFEFIEIKRKV